jgi:hypothetical protein
MEPFRKLRILVPLFMVMVLIMGFGVLGASKTPYSCC